VTTGGGPRDWTRVSEARYGVRLGYNYVYTGPITDVRQRLIMVPPDQYGDQRLLRHAVTIEGGDSEVSTYWEVDRFGNRVCHASIARVSALLDFAVDFDVERRATESPVRLRPTASIAPYLTPTALTAPDDRLRSVAASIASAVPPSEADGHATRQWALARRVNEWAAGAISYQLGVTGVQTPAAMALHLGRGVCQDYAHLALVVLRLVGIPARYVSGHLLGEGAPHAWIEALLPDPELPDRLRAVAYDPTHRRPTRLDYITVAVGRDYADIAPTSGSFSGAAAGRLSARKDARILALTVRDEEVAA
jgi:transglutaminase-like putative cysteine protease